MGLGSFQARFVAALDHAGVTVGGAKPWDIRVRDARLYRRVASQALVGFGDAYVDGWWECDHLDEFFDRAFVAGLPELFAGHPLVKLDVLRQRLTNPQRRGAARRDIRRHYDLGDDLFRAMLDRRMTYSCGYWDGARSLDEAQENKLGLVCRKIGLRPGQRVLDIGCGWGSFASYAAERYGARVVGVTLSPDQARVAGERCRGLPVEIRIQDYRDVNEPFDHVVSIGMFEHVGPRNHRAFMRVARRCLRPGGMLLLHTFATQRSHPDGRDAEVMWVERHIFPGMAVPSLAQIGRALDGVFVVEDVHNFGADYDPTLLAWHDNFEAAWPSLRERYGERFHRLWRYYLLCCAGAFRSRKYQVWQFVLAPVGVRGGYRAPRAAAAPAIAARGARGWSGVAEPQSSSSLPMS
jgi:cyclopropane-fatty-acyl-phospholipid synthase